MKIFNKSFSITRESQIKSYILLILISLISILFRLGPMDFYPVPDEEYVINNQANFYRTGTLEPNHFIHPPLNHYLCLIPQSIFLKLKNSSSLYETFSFYYFNDNKVIYSVCRNVSWFLSIITAPLLYLLTLRIYRSKIIAFISGLFIAISFWHVSMSRFALPDIPLTLFFTISFCFIIIWLNEGKKIFLYSSCFLGGIATAVKLNGAALIFPIIASLWWKADPFNILKNRNAIVKIIILSLMMISSLIIICLDLSGLWLNILLKFSPDGIIHPTTQVYFNKLMLRLAYLGALFFLVAAILLYRYIKLLISQNNSTLKYSKHNINHLIDKTLNLILSHSLYTSLFLFLIGFFIFNPYWLIFFKKFIAIFFLTTIHVQMIGHFGMEGRDWIWYITKLWQDEYFLGIILMIGIVLSLIKTKSVTFGIALFITILFIYVGSWAEKAVRFVIILLPLALMITADSLWRFVEKKRSLIIIFIIILFIVIASQGIATYKLIQKTSLPDSRITAKKWIEYNLPSRSRILVSNYMPDLHSEIGLQYIKNNLTSHGMISVQNEYEKSIIYNIDTLTNYSTNEINWSEYDYLIISSYDYDRFFDSLQLPASNNPLYTEYIKRRLFYNTILNGNVSYLEFYKQFGGGEFYGPILNIYRIKTAKNSL